MAGIYISNMEMPKGDNSVTLFLYPDGKLVMCGMLGPLGDYEAISVPEHGRSIDADAIIRRIPIVSYEIYENIRALIDSAPTIIPADPIKEQTE